MDLTTVLDPQTVVIETVTDTKAPTSFGPFAGATLKCRRRMKVLLNFEKHEPTVEKVGKDYFRTLPWMVTLPGPLVTNKEGTQKYLRFLLLETLEETYLHNGNPVETEQALKYLPKRGKSDPMKPLYMTVKLENIKFSN